MLSLESSFAEMDINHFLKKIVIRWLIFLCQHFHQNCDIATYRFRGVLCMDFQKFTFFRLSVPFQQSLMQ